MYIRIKCVCVYTYIHTHTVPIPAHFDLAASVINFIPTHCRLLPPLHHSHTITTSPTIHLFHQGNCTAKSCFSANSKAFWICHTAEQSITNAECEVLKNVLHRNLIKILSSCCNINFEALVFEFMSNGSPEKWLCFHNYFLDILKRLNIKIDVGLALEYLQHSHSPTLCGSL